MPSPEEIMLQLEQQVNEGLPDPRAEMMKKLLMGAISPPMAAGMGGEALMKMMPMGQEFPPGLLGMTGEGIEEALEEALGDEVGPGKARPAPSPDDKMRFMEVMKLMMPGVQAGGMQPESMYPQMMPSHTPGEIPGYGLSKTTGREAHPLAAIIERNQNMR